MQDTSQTDEERLSCLARLHDHQHLPECMRVMCTSLTDQDQTINRSELRAVCQALRSSLLVEFRHCDIFSDSQYACNCVAKYCVGKCPVGSQPNSDILTEMQAIWAPDRHRLKWVRAHRRLSEARDSVEAWDILQTEQPIVVATVNALAGHIEQEAKMLRGTFRCMISISLAKVDRLRNISKRNETAIVNLSLPPDAVSDRLRIAAGDCTAVRSQHLNRGKMPRRYPCQPLFKKKNERDPLLRELMPP